jgi:hypothetical protein
MSRKAAHRYQGPGIADIAYGMSLHGTDHAQNFRRW